MDHNLPNQLNPSGACANGDHSRCLDADQTCACPCHRGLVARDFSASGAARDTEIHEAPRESDDAEMSTTVDSVGAENSAPTVDEIERVAQWLGLKGHVLVAWQEDRDNDRLGELGRSYWTGWNDGLDKRVEDTDLSGLVDLGEAILARLREPR